MRAELDPADAVEIYGTIIKEERYHLYDSEGTREWILEALSQLLVGPGQLVRDALTAFRYLGPLRETPSRDHAPPRFPDPSRWASGLGAWDRLVSGDEKTEFVDAVSHWLGDRERLNAGYNVRCKRVKELDVSEPWVAQLLTGKSPADADSIRLGLERLPTRSRIQILPSTEDGHVSQDPVELQPQDVGVGISQVVPVIVTALDGKGRLLAIEQPELHLHPRLQAELGDLFIQAAKGETAHTLLLETHSEMIPLRIMRRIRNTVEGSLPLARSPDYISGRCDLLRRAPRLDHGDPRVGTGRERPTPGPLARGILRGRVPRTIRKVDRTTMLYRYALTPDAFEPAAMREENRDGTIVVQLLRGMQRNGLLADLHNGQWLTQVLRQHDSGTLTSALRDHINACLVALQNRNRIIRHPACQPRPDTDDFRWLHWALETHRHHRDFPFHAVFATEEYIELSELDDEVFVPLPKALDAAGWLNRRISVRFTKTEDNLKKHLAPLLFVALRFARMSRRSPPVWGALG